MSSTDRLRWVTFDCFGTLVDWRSGFAAILTPLFGDRTPEVMSAYDRLERRLEIETPHRLYRDVLTVGLRRAAEEVGVPLSEPQARRLPERWGTMPVFEDVEPMLAGLRADGYRLAVLTNCDEALFAQTQRAFRRPFDLIVTAERVADYKPSPAHFRYFSRISGVGDGDWIHVANSWYHDITPARALGIPRVWLDRDDTGEDPAGASERVRVATDVHDAVRKASERAR
jgi:2-haloacid dehalogenase